eukprot:1157244-Pelagomonas_calceolata.AAC.8
MAAVSNDFSDDSDDAKLHWLWMAAGSYDSDNAEYALVVDGSRKSTPMYLTVLPQQFLEKCFSDIKSLHAVIDDEGACHTLLCMCSWVCCELPVCACLKH